MGPRPEAFYTWADSKSVMDLREPPGRERSHSRARAELMQERSERSAVLEYLAVLPTATAHLRFEL